MSLFSMLKNNSKRALGGNWGKAILILAITVGASLLLGFLESAVLNIFVAETGPDLSFSSQYGFDEFFFRQFFLSSAVEIVSMTGFSLLGLLLFAPLSLGSNHWYYDLAYGKQAPVTQVFRYFEGAREYARAVWLYIQISVRSFLWALAFFAAPCGILGASTYTILQNGDEGRGAAALASVGLLFAALLFLLCSVLYIACINRYFLAPYLLVEDSQLSVREAIRISCRYTKGDRFSLLWFELSFIGWALLCVFFFPALYVLPYMNTSMAMYARYLIEKARYTPENPTREFVMEEPPAGEGIGAGTGEPPTGFAPLPGADTFPPAQPDDALPGRDTFPSPGTEPPASGADTPPPDEPLAPDTSSPELPLGETDGFEFPHPGIPPAAPDADSQ